MRSTYLQETRSEFHRLASEYTYLMARRPSHTFLTSRGLEANCTQPIAPAQSENAAPPNLGGHFTNGGCVNMKTTGDRDLSVCLSALTSHKAKRRLEPCGPLVLPSPAASCVPTAGLSGHIWQHVTAAVLLHPKRSCQLQLVHVYTVH